MAYSVVTKNDQLFAIVLGNPYELSLPSEYSIHEIPETNYPDLNIVNWDNSLGEWVESSTKLTKLKFLNRFTMQERIVIRASTDPIVADIMNLFDAAEYIDTQDVNTIQGIGYLNAIGIISNTRLAEVLS